MNRIGTTTTAAQADPTDDVSPPEAQLSAYLAQQLACGVPHRDLLFALLANFHAMATVYPCCTELAARAALNVGGRLLAASIERPANAPIH
jgi:hypothetical protein